MTSPVALHSSPDTTGVELLSWYDGTLAPVNDLVAVEEPLEIRLAGVPVAVTMRTPGNDLDLAVGFLYAEQVIRSASDIATLAHCETDDPRNAGNVVNVNPTDSALVDPAKWGRTFGINSSCGVCGKEQIDQIRLSAPPIKSSLRLMSEILVTLPRKLYEEQHAFGRTGGVHAAGLFDRNGELIVAREDVGRHNAVDKAIGAMVRTDALPLSDTILCVSSRASFEIVQKAFVAGIPAVATVSAPSSLAISLAREAGMILIAFLRDTRFNVYSGAEYIAKPTPNLAR